MSSVFRYFKNNLPLCCVAADLHCITDNALPANHNQLQASKTYPLSVRNYKKAQVSPTAPRMPPNSPRIIERKLIMTPPKSRIKAEYSDNNLANYLHMIDQQRMMDEINKKK